MEKDPVDRLIYILECGKENYEYCLQECSKEKNISKQEINVLLGLQIHSKKTHACDIVHEKGFSKSYVSKALNSLLQKGFIRVETDSQDRRYQHIVLEDSAKEIISYMEKKREEMVKRTTKNICPEELDIFWKVSEMMVSNLKQEEDESSV